MRSAGILLAVSSLPSPHGIGDFGPHAYQFVDLLAKGNVKLWQMLPLNPLGYGNSPYQPYSSKAMDELYLSLDLLHEQGLIRKPKPFQAQATKVDYDAVRKFKTAYFEEAFRHFQPDVTYQRFIKENPWVEMYAIFMTFKEIHQLQMWTTWQKEFKTYVKNKAIDLAPYLPRIQYHQMLQYLLSQQFIALKAYANRHGVQLVGDIPIYVGIDSIDVWMNQAQFMLTADGEPTHIAGVPPDYFSKTGQRWGNPLYRWDVMEQDGFQFWLDRLGYNAKLFDIIRIDHFRAFDTYWKIPASCPTAVEGAWIEAPGYALFDAIKAGLPHVNIIAEDLGDLRPQVLTLRDHYQLPGMKIMQFEFPIYPNGQGQMPNAVAPTFPENAVAYTGTHDNQTTMGWYQLLSPASKTQLAQFLKPYQGTIAEQLIQVMFASKIAYAIVPMQDVLSLDDQARMNVPGTIGSPNWEWKLASFDAFEKRIPTFANWVKENQR
ncbi:MAG: 4-alpha-glucanotransferase [Bacilli bacterium]